MALAPTIRRCPILSHGWRCRHRASVQKGQRAAAEACVAATAAPLTNHTKSAMNATVRGGRIGKETPCQSRCSGE